MPLEVTGGPLRPTTSPFQEQSEPGVFREAAQDIPAVELEVQDVPPVDEVPPVDLALPTSIAMNEAPPVDLALPSPTLVMEAPPVDLAFANPMGANEVPPVQLGAKPVAAVEDVQAVPAVPPEEATKVRLCSLGTLTHSPRLSTWSRRMLYRRMLHRLHGSFLRNWSASTRLFASPSLAIRHAQKSWEVSFAYVSTSSFLHHNPTLSAGFRIRRHRRQYPRRLNRIVCPS